LKIAMPIYEYACNDCGFAKEVLQKLSDSPLTKCPECKAETFRKQVSAPGFRLAGSGWYETDFKTGKKKNLVADASSSQSSGSTA
jgi:putative FmdB family regulatory protein